MDVRFSFFSISISISHHYMHIKFIITEAEEEEEIAAAVGRAEMEEDGEEIREGEVTKTPSKKTSRAAMATEEL